MGDIISILLGVFKFWDQVTWLVKFLQVTPEEQHEQIIAKIQKEADAIAQGGRPNWDVQS